MKTLPIILILNNIEHFSMFHFYLSLLVYHPTSFSDQSHWAYLQDIYNFHDQQPVIDSLLVHTEQQIVLYLFP